MCYFWVDNRPCGGGYNKHISSHAAIYDVGSNSNMTIQRSVNNGYHPTNCQTVPNTQFTVNATSGYWGTGTSGTSTYNPIYPDHIQIGLEVFGGSGQYSPRADWTNNQWINTGSWSYQHNAGATTVSGPVSGGWAVVPPPTGGTGGDWWASCGC
jgi:hypothetical protein